MKPAPLAALMMALSITFLPGLNQAAPTTPESNAEKTSKTWTEPLTGMKFVWIESGCFQMGQLPLEARLLKREIGQQDYNKYYADELPRHKVCLSGFWMGATEVTQKEWVKVMGFNPSHFNTNENFPTDMVSWEDANNFIAKLNSGNKTEDFRLPTEAEWEFAARGDGKETMYHTGNSITTKQANYNGSIAFGLNLREEYRKSPVQVGSFPPNSYGLYDMHGNVWEWCNDWYGERYYDESPEKNPPGPTEEGQMRVLRGGSWFRYSGHIRSATRYKNKPTGQYADTGFRVVKSSPKDDEEERNRLIFNPNF